jgi:hypothetical protein
VSGLPANRAPLVPDHETQAADGPGAPERQLLDYLIERAWESCLRTLREHRSGPDLDRIQQEP